jgi:hypothetical protein
MSEFATFRFGWDAESRISGTTVMLQEQGALPVGAPLYSPVPFLPGGSTPSAIGGTTEDGHPIWMATPTRVDLIFYQGDDVVIPLYFDNPDITADDMSTMDWFAQIRRGHLVTRTLVADFSVAATYTAAGVDTPEYTKVEMYLPRASNDTWGSFEWEIASYGDSDLSRFPPPPGWGDEPWPPPQALKTWLFGRCYIVPRTTATDELGTPTTEPGVVTLGARGFVVAPNGMLSTGGNPSVGVNALGQVTVVQ